jgi:hypothetical protein
MPTVANLATVRVTASNFDAVRGTSENFSEVTLPNLGKV